MCSLAGVWQQSQLIYVLVITFKYARPIQSQLIWTKEYYFLMDLYMSIVATGIIQITRQLNMLIVVLNLPSPLAYAFFA